MSRNVIGIVAAFTLLVGGVMATTQSEAVAGHHRGGCGGYVCGGNIGGGCGGQGCGGGLFARLKARHHSSCAAPAPVCQPVVHHCGGQNVCGGHKACGGGLFAKLRAHRQSNSCCAPEPVCCAPEPAPCCDAAPVAAPCCTAGEYAAPVAAPCCEVIVSEEAVYDAAPVEEGSSSDAPPAPEAEVEVEST